MNKKENWCLFSNIYPTHIFEYPRKATSNTWIRWILLPILPFLHFPKNYKNTRMKCRNPLSQYGVWLSFYQNVCSIKWWSYILGFTYIDKTIICRTIFIWYMQPFNKNKTNKTGWFVYCDYWVYSLIAYRLSLIAYSLIHRAYP